MFLFLFGIYNMAVSFTSVTFQIGTPVCSGPAAAHNTLTNVSFCFKYFYNSDNGNPDDTEDNHTPANSSSPGWI